MLTALLVVALGGGPSIGMRQGNGPSIGIIGPNVRPNIFGPSVAPLPVAPEFSFADSNAYLGYAAYAGLPATDGCHPGASITNTKGDVALTFSRSTTSFCPVDTGNQASGTTCAVDEACIIDRKLQIFRQYSNQVTASEQFEQGWWIKYGAGGGSAAVVTADDAVAPDGTTTADKVVVTACPGSGDYSVVYANLGGPAICSWSIWLKGSGTISLYYYSPSANVATPITLTADWKRWTVSNVACAAGASGPGFGCNNAPGYTGSSNTGAATFWAWGASVTDGMHYEVPYHKTSIFGGEARTADIAYFTYASPFNPVSMAATASYDTTLPRSATNFHGYLEVYETFFNFIRMYNPNTTDVRCMITAGGSELSDKATVDGTDRVACNYSAAAGISVCLDGSCATPAPAGAYAATGSRFYIGQSNVSGYATDGLISNVCLSSTLGACDSTPY